MSLFGKILALLNIFGAAGLVFLAIMDYNKRQVWAYWAFRHELVLTGLPLDDHELDAQGLPLVNKIGPQTENDLFGKLGGNPVRTQVQEVQRLQKLLEDKYNAQGITKRQQSYALARILLQLSEAYIDREQCLACIAHLESDQTLTALRKRYTDAFAAAIVPGDDKDQKTLFADVFRLAVRRQPGVPSERFTTLVLQGLPAETDKARAAKIDKAFDDALELQRVQLLVRLQTQFAQALQTDIDNVKKVELGRSGQKMAIASLLYNLALYLTEDKIDTDASLVKEKADLQKLKKENPVAWVKKLTATDTYKTLIQRSETVVGLGALQDAIGRQALVVRGLANQVNDLINEDRDLFVEEHVFLVQQVSEAAAQLRAEVVTLKDIQDKTDDIKKLVQKRKTEIDDPITGYNKEIADWRKKTADKAADIQALSEQLLQVRLKVRDALKQNQDGEKKIRDLEAKVKELERKK